MIDDFKVTKIICRELKIGDYRQKVIVNDIVEQTLKLDIVRSKTEKSLEETLSFLKPLIKSYLGTLFLLIDNPQEYANKLEKMKSEIKV